MNVCEINVSLNSRVNYGIKDVILVTIECNEAWQVESVVLYNRSKKSFINFNSLPADEQQFIKIEAAKFAEFSALAG